jgi:hypothetical protein
MAPVTFFRDFSSWIDISDSIRAGCHAVSAADAPVRIDVDNPIRAFDAGIDGTDCHTDWFFAVIAEDGQEEFSRVGIMPFFDCGTSFSLLQAKEHALHPMHFLKSIKTANRLF